MLSRTPVVLCSLAALAAAHAPALADGWTWDFNQSLAARYGDADPLGPHGTFAYEFAQIDGQAAGVVHFYAGGGPDTDAYFTVSNPAGVNGGGGLYTNSYTLIYDVRFPASTWVSFFQSNVDNGNDGECFIRADGGIGISGDYEDSGNALRYPWDQWARVAIVIETGSPPSSANYRCYIDGVLQNQVQSPSGWGVDARFSLDTVFHLFADESGDTPAEGWVNCVQMRDYPMTADEVAALGGATAAGIPDDDGSGGGGDTGFYVTPIVQNVQPTSAWIMWESESGDESRVDFGATTDLGQTANGSAQASSGSRRIHTTQLTGLQPDTTYYYAATTGDSTSETHHFRTFPLPTSEKPFRFAAVSDTQSDFARDDQLLEVIRDGIVAYSLANHGPDLADNLAFWLDAGDIVDQGPQYWQWKEEFFDEVKDLSPYVPLFAVPGNHEQDSHWFFDYFVLPENGTPGFMEHWYYFDYSNVRVIGLDSNAGYQIQAQLDWLQAVLDDTAGNEKVDFVFAQLHHPALSELWTPGNTGYSMQVVRMLEQFTEATGKPSVHFFGHTHAYSRGQSRDHQHLWVNVASGEGNLDYWGEYPQADYPEFQYSKPDYGFAMIEVQAGDEPSFRLDRLSRGTESNSADNELIDSITIRLNNAAPATPAAVFPTDADSPVDPDGLTLRASGFSDADGDDHWESHFQITATPGDYADPVVDEWIRFENWYAPPGATGSGNGWYSVNTVTDPDVTRLPVAAALEGQATYAWRVRYRDEGLEWSDWSAEVTFTTGDSAFGPNLLTNPGAEQGTTGWTVLDPPLESLAANDCGSLTDPVEGSRFWAIGGVCANEGDYGEAMQAVDVSDHADAIDDGLARVNVRGWLKDYGGSDRPEIWAVFKDAGGTVIDQTTKLGSLSPAWEEKTSVDPVPAGTRTIEFHLSGTRNGGTDNDSYADALELRLGIRDTCVADFNDDGNVNTQDIIAFLNAWASGDASADINGDGTVNTQDVLAFLNLWNAGC